MLIKSVLARSVEAMRLRRLRMWANAEAYDVALPKTNNVGFLAGYGNTSYGDYFIGLGLAIGALDFGLNPVLIGRDSEMSAFKDINIKTVAIPDRDHGLREFESLVRGLDRFVLGGGGLFEDRVDSDSSQLLAAGYAARALYASNRGIPMAVHGVGLEVQPYSMPGTERLLEEMFRAARSVGVRDRESVTACTRFKVSAKGVVDPAVIFLASIRRESESVCGTAGFIPFARLAWPNIAMPKDADHRRQYVDWQTAARDLTAYKRVIVAPFHRSDLNFIPNIVEAIKRENPDATVEVVPFDPKAPGAVLAWLVQCEHVLTMRYHGFMASHFAGVPSISVLGGSQKLRVTDSLNRDGTLAELWNSVIAKQQLNATLSSISSSADVTNR